LPPLVGLASARRWAYQWQLWMLLPSALLTTVSGSCFGFLTWPGAVILMIYWTKPAIKAYHEGC
ncbi:MAG TPA: hypothetical protein VK689_13215, partial [Armatimonadota bacterium]|nr:hypothetical protein [Armatimonadota bacterium]